MSDNVVSSFEMGFNYGKNSCRNLLEKYITEAEKKVALTKDDNVGTVMREISTLLKNINSHMETLSL
jgi:thymidylate kinase